MFLSSYQRIAAFFPELFILMSPCPSPSARKSNLQFTQKMQDYQLLAIFWPSKNGNRKIASICLICENFKEHQNLTIFAKTFGAFGEW